MVVTGLVAIHTEILPWETSWKYTVPNSEALVRFARSRILVQFIVTGFAHYVFAHYYTV